MVTVVVTAALALWRSPAVRAVLQRVVLVELRPALRGVVAVVSGRDDGDGAAESGHGEVAGRSSGHQGRRSVALHLLASIRPLMLVLGFPNVLFCNYRAAAFTNHNQVRKLKQVSFSLLLKSHFRWTNVTIYIFLFAFCSEIPYFYSSNQW